MSLERAQQLVTTYIAAGETELSPELLDLVNGGAGSLGLLGLVRALGEYLTSVEDEPRLRALALLSTVLAQSPKDKINRQSTRVLTDFYIEKLSDVLLLTPALQGLLTLSGLPTFGSSETLLLAPALFKINVRALSQAVRFLIFKTIDTLMHLHRPALQRLGPAGFVKPYCTRIAEGEKDPRNLLLAFSLAKVIILEFDIASCVEELFDVTYCYFPITYRPPPKDPYGISTEDLRTSLRACLAGSALFARQAMPLLLEKLAGSGGEMKIDTLKTLEACLPVFGRDNAQAYQAELWEGLKVEVLYASSDDTETAALQTMQVFLPVLVGSSASAGADDHDFFDGVILGEMEATLREPEKSLASQIVKILSACFAASQTLGRKSYSKILPQLLTQFHASDTSITQKQAILTSLAALIHSAVALYALPSSAPDAAEPRTVTGDGVFLEMKDQLLGVLTAGLSVEEGQQAAMEGLLGLREWVETEEVDFIVSKLGSLLSEENVGDDVREHALHNLAKVAQSNPKPIGAQILPPLFSALPDRAPTLEEDDLRAAYRRALACLGILAVESTLFDALVTQILAKLAHLSLSQGDAPPEAAVYAFALLSCVEKVLRKKVDGKHTDVPPYADRLLLPLFGFFARPAVGRGGTVAAEPRLIVVGGKIVELVVQVLPVDRQSAFVKRLHAAFVEGKLQEITDDGAADKVAFAPLAMEAPASQRNLLVLYASGVIALRPNVELPISDLSPFLADVLQWSLATSTTFLQLKSMFHLFASLVNKHCDSLQPFLEHTVPAFWAAEVNNKQASAARRKRSIRAWVWLCRSLLVRNHELGYDYLTQLLDLLAAEDDHQLVLDAAKALAIIAEGDGDGVLTKRNHAIIRLLHKQKFFNFVIPKIEDGYSATKGTEWAVVYLVVLASIIPALPRALCVSSLPTLLPFLLKSLDLPDPDLKANVIQTLEQVAQVDEPVSHEAIEKQAVKLVESLLRCLDVAASNERSRTAALRTLAVLPDVVRYEVLLPTKTTVLKELGKALDDKRRTVRKEAVDCRSRWYLYH